MQMLSSLLLPSEVFQHFVHDSHCRLAATHLTTRAKETKPFLGRLALTNQRLIFFGSNHYQAFPLCEIHSVHRKIQVIYFNTNTQKVQVWRPSGNRVSIVRTFDFASTLEQLLNTIIAANTLAPPAASKQSQHLQAAINCSRCGANVLVVPGTPAKCEYCGSLVQT